MNAVLIYAHPNPASFNASLAQVVKEELEKKEIQVKLKDLYAMNWNPVLSAKEFQDMHNGTVSADIKQEQDDISAADIVVFIAPVWWFSVPAILKGYIDRVFSIGFAYAYENHQLKGLLKGKKALLIITAGADEGSANQTGMIDVIQKSLVNGFFAFSGFDEYKFKLLYAVPSVTNEERKQMLSEVRVLVNSL